MPVFNIAANQSLSKPVDAHYEGKAVRLALKNKELANQQAQQEIAANLPERKMVAVEERNELLRDQEGRLKDATERDVQAQTAEIGINAAMSGYDAYHATEGDEATKKQAGYEATLSVIDNMVPGGRDAALEFIRETQGREYTPEEFDVNEARALIAPLLSKGKEGDSEFERLIANMPPEMQERLRRQRAEKLSSFAPKKEDSSAVRPLSTPTKIETEMVQTGVDKVIKEKLAEHQKTFSAEYEISDKETKRVYGWAGETAKAIMTFEGARGNPMGMNSAIDRAANEASKFLVSDKEPGLFFDAALSFDPPQHLIGQHLELNDQVYVVEGYADDGEPMVSLVE